MPRTQANRAAEARYKAKNQKTVAVNFFPPSMELYKYLVAAAEESGMKPAQYLRELLRQDVERKNNGEY